MPGEYAMFESIKGTLRQSKRISPGRAGACGALALATVIFALIAAIGGVQAVQAYSNTPNENSWVTDGAVYAIVDNSTTVYIGGDFAYVGPNTGYGVPIDSSTASPSANYPKVNGTIYAAVPDGSGGWYIGGDFTMVGTLARNRIAHILGSGAVESSWDPNADDTVFCLSVSGSKVYAGGDFSQIGGQPRNRVAALDATTGTATSWNPNSNSTVYTLAVYGSKIYVGGEFSSIGVQARNHIAAVDATTGLASSWNPNADYTVWTIVPSGSTVYVGGEFSTIGGQIRNNIAALNASTGLASSWDPNADNAVYSLAVNGTTVYVAGWFTSIGGQPRNSLAAVDASTGLATSWDPNADNTAWTIAVAGTTVYAGGWFTSIGGQARNYMAAIDISTGVATSWNPNADSWVYALAVSGSMIYAGGDFTSVGGQPRNRIAAIDVETGLATTWNPNADNAVYALTVSGSTVYAGGWFTNIGGEDRYFIAALDAATGLATSWDPDADDTVWTLTVNGSSIYAGGDFVSIGGELRNRIAALDVTTGLASPWDPDADGTVWTLAIKGSIIYAGGDFGNIGGQARNKIAALNAETGLATSWDPNADDTVYTLAVEGSTIYAGGGFTSIGGLTRNNIAALSAGTGLATSWDPNADDTVYALTVNASIIYAGGDFTNIAGEDRHFLAALNGGTGLADIWDPQPNDTVMALGAKQNRLYAGGWFNRIDNKSHPHFARFDISTLFGISGTVTSGGAPLSGVRIDLNGAVTNNTNTDNIGNYSFTGLPNGVYTLTPTKSGYTFTPPTLSPNVIGANVVGQNFVGTFIGFSVSGTVTSGGAPLPGVSINLTGAATKNTTTDSNGNYTLTGLFNGAYTITPSKTSYNFSPTNLNINVNGANIAGLNFTASGPPVKATLVSPSGTITTTRPVYRWNAVSGSTFYNLVVSDSTGIKINRWFSATEAGCSAGTGICSVSPATDIQVGPANWWIDTWNPNGPGPWSDTGSFTVSAPEPPGKATQISPSESIDTNLPTYTWNPASRAIWYWLYVYDSKGNVISSWYSASQAGCPDGTGTCSIKPETPVAVGKASWWVVGWNTSGLGIWSDGLSFDVPCKALSDAPTLIAPVGAINTNVPTYSWNALTNADSYWLLVADSTGALRVNRWYGSAEAGCDTGTCSVNLGIPLPPGSATWYIMAASSCGENKWSWKGFTVPTLTAPGKPTLLSPHDTIHTNRPTYTWEAVANTDYYWLLAWDESANSWAVNNWYSAADAGCLGSATCSVTPPVSLVPSYCVWYVLPWSYGGWGQLSDSMSFVVSSEKPGKPTLKSPGGTLGNNDPTFAWDAVPYAEYYWLLANDSTGSWPVNMWYSAAEAGCSTGTCSVDTGIHLAPGNCTWYLLPWNYAGFGALGGPMAFAVQ
jgi:trimeric autotransporter adhesin